MQLYTGKNNERLLSNHRSSTNIPENVSKCKKKQLMLPKVDTGLMEFKTLSGGSSNVSKKYSLGISTRYIESSTAATF